MESFKIQIKMCPRATAAIWISLERQPQGDREALKQMFDGCGRRSTKSLADQFANPGNKSNGVRTPATKGLNNDREE